MSAPGRVARGLAILHEVVVLVVLALSLLLGSLAWAPLVAALPVATSVLSGPWSGLHHGIAWTWPALAVAVVGLALGLRLPTRRFVAMVLAGRNVLPGVVVGIAGVGIARVIVGLGVLAVLSPADARLPVVPTLLTAAWWLAAMLVAGRVAGGRTLGAALAAGWAVTWRTVGMVVPLATGALGALALALGVAVLPGFALVAALVAEPGSPIGSLSAGIAFKAASIPWVVVSGAWFAAVVTALGSVVPGHVFWRVVEGAGSFDRQAEHHHAGDDRAVGVAGAGGGAEGGGAADGRRVHQVREVDRE